MAAALSVAALIGLDGCNGNSAEPAARPSATRSTSPAATTSTTSTPAPGLPSGWVDDEVTFVAGGLTIHGTYRHATAADPAPAVLLIPGSGPTDRNGNQGSTQENSLRLLADALAADGVASLRYDKLFSGATGAGGFATDPGAAGVSVFEDEARAGLVWLAGQSRSDAARLSVMGHSEGGLYALLLAADPKAGDPPVSSLGLVEPLSRRFLDVVAEQLRAQIDAAVRAGKITAATAAQAEAQIDQTIAAVRAGRALGQLPSYLANLFSPAVVPYLRDIDGYDPADVARRVPPTTRVLLTCSRHDPQVTCADVDHLAAGLRDAQVDLTYAHLAGMDHALKADSSTTGAHNTDDLPLYPPLATAIAHFFGADR